MNFRSLAMALSLITLSSVAVATPYGGERFGDEPFAGESFGGRPSRGPALPAPGSSLQGENGAKPAKSVEEARELGVKWLLANQSPDGGWAAGAWGGEAAGSDVATTAVAVRGLIRDGKGVKKHETAIQKGLDFVLKAVETAPKDGPRLNTPENTQPQYKIGPLVDTHMASVLLGEASGKFDAKTNSRILVALDVVIGKQQAAQTADGRFETSGWAPVISNTIAAQGLTMADELGRDVKDEVLKRNDDWQATQTAPNGAFDTSSGAGVELYAVASGLGNARSARGRAQGGELAKVEEAAAARVSADSDGRLVAGFGSVGGEEIMSYLMISDALAEKGGKDYDAWQGKITSFLQNIQNQDGSWSGHHCITSTPFTTAAAVMTLGAGRVVEGKGGKPVPVEVGDHREIEMKVR